MRFINLKHPLKQLFNHLYFKYKLYGVENPLQVSVAGYSAKFHLSTRTEYDRVRSLANDAALLDLMDALKLADTYWDVGANIGTHSLFPARVLDDGSVLSIEAFPKNVEKLKRNIQLNNAQNVHVESVALGQDCRKIELNIEGGEAGSGGHSIVTREGSESITVPMVTGDSLLTQYDPPNVMKIDVQGAELEVLDGMSTVLSDHCRYLICEVHQRRGVPVNEVTQRLESLGFAIETFDSEGSTTQLRAFK